MSSESEAKTEPALEPDAESRLLRGLTQAEVDERIAQGAVNADANVKTRSIKEICQDNILTLFNAVNVVLFVLVLLTGSLKNGLFMIVIVCNVIIGIVQEIRSKRTIDRLSIMTASKVDVVRDGVRRVIPVDQIVRDDIIVLRRGNQVPADCRVIEGSCDANESLLTGESDLIHKQVGSELMSGSFVNSGTVHARVEHVGAENFAARITAEAKTHKAVNSQIMTSLNSIIKFVTYVLGPLGALLLARQYFFGNVLWQEAMLSTVAALVGCIPEGLILLTSTVLAVAVVRLAKSQVLVQQLYCIETLARVDTLCLDKTGTITSGAMEVDRVCAMASADDPDAQAHDAAEVFYALACADADPNETANAIMEYGKEQGLEQLAVARSIPFSSDKKWSGGVLGDGRAFVMGAGQFVLGEGFAAVAEEVGALAAQARVLVLARVDGFDDEGNLQGAPVAVGMIAIRDQIRSTAAETIGFFKEQGVDLKVISGDDPRTVSGIAAQVGIPNADRYVDATTLKTEEEVADAIERYSVFGRVKPDQKKAFVVALQNKGHIVAMTGDGVNDTLALKQADCSVAMAAGSDAARNVAHLVLVDNDFASMPKVVAEGRRSINNLQRSASLFLVKTVLSLVLGILFVLLPWQYPFQPIQMTLVSAFTIGLPSFVLALEPNKDRIKGKFLENVVVKSLPGSFAGILGVLVLNVIGYMILGLNHDQVSTMCVLMLAWVGLNLILRLSFPFTPIRMAMIAVVVVGTGFAILFLPKLFGIAPFTGDMLVTYFIVAAISAVFFHVSYNLLDSWHDRRMSKLV